LEALSGLAPCPKPGESLIHPVPTRGGGGGVPQNRQEPQPVIAVGAPGSGGHLDADFAAACSSRVRGQRPFFF